MWLTLILFSRFLHNRHRYRSSFSFLTITLNIYPSLYIYTPIFYICGYILTTLLEHTEVTHTKDLHFEG